MGGKPARDLAPKTLCQASARALLELHGWACVAGGKHVVKMVKEGERPITLPMHRGGDYGPQLRSSILKAAGIKGAPAGTEVDKVETGKHGDEER